MALAKKKAHDDTMNMGGRRVKVVRGGGICKPGEKGAIIRGSLSAAICLTTPGPDPRPRWRVAGKPR